MKKQFVLGLAGGILGLVTALYVIATAPSSDVTLSGVQAALFSTLGLMGAAIARKETRFAGWMIISSAVWITLSVPVAGTLNLLYLYLPTIVILFVAAVLCFRETEPEDEDAVPA
jgi:RsiW-degrading membrane proteinase PrsW (M82 family)